MANWRGDHQAWKEGEKPERMALVSCNSDLRFGRGEHFKFRVLFEKKVRGLNVKHLCSMFVMQYLLHTRSKFDDFRSAVIVAMRASRGHQICPIWRKLKFWVIFTNLNIILIDLLTSQVHNFLSRYRNCMKLNPLRSLCQELRASSNFFQFGAS